MIKVKDGYGKLIGTTYKGSADHLLRSNGDTWAVHTGRNNEANKIVRTDSNGQLQVGWINTTSGNLGTANITRIYCSNDNYIRYKTPENFFSTLSNNGDNISITVASQNRTLVVGYSKVAGQLRSKGTISPQTGRTQSLGDVYSYHLNGSVSGGPTKYASVIGFGRGTSGTVEIAGEWTSGRGLWVRALRDTTDNWYAWDKVLTQATYTGITDSRYYTKTQADKRFVNVTGDIMTGTLTINTPDLGTQLIINRGNTTSLSAITYKNNSGILGRIGVGGSGNGASSRQPFFASGSSTTLFRIWHEGNDGSGSGLDADLLDGTHKSGLFTALTSTSAANLSATIGGTTKTIADLYATYAQQMITTRYFWGQPYNGTQNVTGSLTGVTTITISNSGNGTSRPTTGLNINGIRGTMAGNDQWAIFGYGTASNGGYMEIATGDGGNEPIYVAQYSGGAPYSTASTRKHGITLMDSTGNQIFSTVTGVRYISTIGTGTAPLTVTSTTKVTNLNADFVDNFHAIGTSGNALRKSGYLTSGTAGLSSYWGKVASFTWNNKQNDQDITLYMHSAYNSVRGIVHIRARWNSSSSVNVNCWIVTGNLDANDLRLYYNASSATSTLELWYNVGGQWGVINTSVISETGRTSTETFRVTLYNTSFSTVQTPSLSRYVSGSYIHLYNSVDVATKLQTARTINGTSFNGTANITTAYWGATRTITLSGAVTGSASVNGSQNVTITTTYQTGSIDGRYVGGKKAAGHGSKGTAYTADTYSSNFVNKAFVAYAERGSWSYANNGYITTNTGVNIPLAGTAVFQWGASDTNKTQLFITPHNNSGVSNPATNEMLFYTSNGSGFTSAWTRVLTHRNYTTYTVTKTGRGASGTWGISITGNAATANRIISHSISDTLANKTTPGYLYHAGGNNSVKDKPSGVGAFGVFTMQTASGWYGQLLMSSNTSTGLYWRTATSLNGGWKKILDSSNYTAYVNPANFVTSLGTNGNYVTWTKNGTTNNLTVPYATASIRVNSSSSVQNTGLTYYSSGSFVVGGTAAGGQWGMPSDSQDASYKNGQCLRMYWSSTYYTDILSGPNNMGTTHGLYLRQIVNGSVATGTFPGGWRLLLDSYNYQRYGDSRYVTLTTNQTVSGIKTFSKQQKFTVATGTSPFTVSSTTVVSNLNADMLDGWHLNYILKDGYVTSGTPGLSSYWRKVWDITLNRQHNDVDINLFVHSAYNQQWGIISFRLRQNRTGTAKNISAYLAEVVGNIPLNRFRLYYNNSSGLCQLWCNPSGQYNVYNYRVLAKTWRTGTEATTLGTFYTGNTTTAQSLPSGSYVSMTGITIVNTAAKVANTLTFSAGKFSSKTYNGSSAITVNVPTRTSHLTNDSGFLTGNVIRAVSANGYWGMARPDSNTSDWIRTTSSGIIPYRSGGRGAGHCGLGNPSWYFSSAYIDTVHGNLDGTATNADKLDGFHANTSQNPFGKIPTIGSNGVMEVGRYLDFHYNSSDTSNYRTRLQINHSSGSYTAILPAKSGTLAMTSDIPTVTNYYWANVRVSSSSNTSTSPTFSTAYTSNWFRSTGSTGWQSQTYGGGWYMSDSTWIRTYGSKSVYQNTGQIRTDGYLVTNGGITIGATSPNNDTYKLYCNGQSYHRGDSYYTAAIRLNNRGNNSIYCGPNDAANTIGGALNNLVFSSWNGVSFTTSCSGQTCTNKNAVSINCRTGQLNAYQVYANGFHHRFRDSNNYVLLAGGSYKNLADFAKGNAGSATQGVYVTGGTVKAMTYSLKATVNSGSSGKLAYYSGTNSIDDYTSTKGSSSTPIYLNAGIPTVCSGVLVRYYAKYIVTFQPTVYSFSRTIGNHYFINTITRSGSGTMVIGLRYPNGYTSNNTIINIIGRYQPLSSMNHVGTSLTVKFNTDTAFYIDFLIF